MSCSPPDSRDRREFLPLLSAKSANSAHVSRFLLDKPNYGERTAGEIRHREKWYPGEQKGIVTLELWQKVQAQLESNLTTRRKRAREHASSLLTGLIEDVVGNRFTPSFTVRRGRRYRYYVSQVAVQNPGGKYDGIINRI